MKRAYQKGFNAQKQQHNMDRRHIRNASSTHTFNTEAIGAFMDERAHIEVLRSRAVAAELEAMRTGMPGSWTIPGGREVCGSPLIRCCADIGTVIGSGLH